MHFIVYKNEVSHCPIACFSSNEVHVSGYDKYS